jgi:hypothetical protein
MTSRKIGQRSALITVLLVSAALLLALPAGSLAAGGNLKTRGSTGHAIHLRGSSAVLTGVVYPEKVETSYYFQYGTTTAYGSQTPTAVAGDGETKVVVGQPITGLAPGTIYHFRLVLVIGATTLVEHDKTFKAGGTVSNHLAFKLVKTSTADVYGTPFIISGTLTGPGSANAPIALQASPYPYLEPFVNVGATGTTNSAGAFSFRISNLTMNTQFRVVELGTLPIYSPVLTEQVALNVTLHVATTKRPGFVRLYGDVTPAKAGTPIVFQVQKAIRPDGKSERTARYVTTSTTKIRKGGKTFSRFSAIVEIRRAGRYRAFVKLGRGPLVSGASNSIVIHVTAPKRAKRGRKSRR